MTTDVATRDRETKPSSWVQAALDARDLSDAKAAVLTHRFPSTIYRWRTKGIDLIDWIGLLTLLAMPPTWRPGDVVPPLPEGWSVSDPFPQAAPKKKAGR